MKAVNALLLAMGLASGFSVQAHTENQDLCYPLAMVKVAWVRRTLNTHLYYLPKESIQDRTYT